MITSQVFAVIVAMQIRASFNKLKLEICISVMLPWWSIVLGTTVLVWKITSQGLRFYSNCCNADPCMGIAYTNWLCCHDSLGGTSLVWWISSQACSSSSFQSADDHIEVVKMCWHRYEDRVNICTRRRGVSSWICRYFSSLIVFALCKPYWIVEYKFIITSFEEFLHSTTSKVYIVQRRLGC